MVQTTFAKGTVSVSFCVRTSSFGCNYELDKTFLDKVVCGYILASNHSPTPSSVGLAGEHIPPCSPASRIYGVLYTLLHFVLTPLHYAWRVFIYSIVTFRYNESLLHKLHTI